MITVMMMLVASLDERGEDEEGQQRRYQIWHNPDKNIQTVSNLQVIPWIYLLTIAGYSCNCTYHYGNQNNQRSMKELA
jgi:hypothetical protein